jgi:hypothetical protein
MVLKPDHGWLTQGEVQVKCQEGQPKLTQINIRIKVIINIVSKPKSGLIWGKCSGHRLGRST